MRAPSQHKPDRQDLPATTLGDVLYANQSTPVVVESDWVALVKAIGTGNQSALHSLYERSHHLVFTLTMRITKRRETAEEVTLDVFHDIWRRALSYDAANGTVLGWIMNQARSRAIDRVRYEQRKKRTVSHPNDPSVEREAASARDLVESEQQRQGMREALAVLTPDERRVIEAAYFAGLSHVEVARRLDQPLGTVKTRIRSGLHKLRKALVTRAIP